MFECFLRHCQCICCTWSLSRYWGQIRRCEKQLYSWEKFSFMLSIDLQGSALSVTNTGASWLVKLPAEGSSLTGGAIPGEFKVELKCVDGCLDLITIPPGLANARPLGLVRGARQRAHCWWKTVRRRAAHRSLQHQGLNLELFEMHIAYWSKFELEIIAVAFAQLSRSMGRQRMLQTSLMDLQFWESS